MLPYRAIPVFHEHAGYAEIKRVLHPRWYLAARGGYLNPSAGSNRQSIEATVGFRPGNQQLVKFGYEAEHYSQDDTFAKTFVIQYVTTIHPLSLSRN